MLSHVATNYLTSGQDGKRWGTAHPSLVPYQSFLSKDGKYLTIGAGNNRHFEAICNLLDLPDLPHDSRFINNGDRVVNREALIKILSERFSSENRSYWENLFAQNNVNFPWGPGSFKILIRKEWPISIKKNELFFGFSGEGVFMCN